MSYRGAATEHMFL